MSLTYPAKLSSRPGGVLVAFPDLPDARTFGRDERGALAAAVDCLSAALALRIKHGEPLPAPSPAGPDEHLVTAPAT